MAKKPRRQPEEEGESAGPPFRQWCRQFFTRLAASPLSLSVSHLLGNSLAPTSPLFTVCTASQSAFQV